ncbi:aspartate/methionine/tyrosine aminotransferase [Kibdelosporangium banguiense]|uniref:Aminotransferase n=1 Tax=Kibdelosporangium banguiense TaxID=1365924 RepID=A0ABS4TCA4_9PSEU|nr:pyridoxal phosphate-dependent aminotransferase [Kibdelosporangium banguiense]MBP2322068.1 aspartate/methionine/tyrosine aminotransferase [Kibdelosporangium banguiense]
MRDLTVAARAAVPPFYVMDVLEAANARQRAKGDVVSLAAGQPSASASAPVLEAAQKALYSTKLGYTEQLGIPELREAIAAHYERTYALEVSPQDVVVTTGSSGGFLLSFLAAFDPGDRVALARPGYPAYRNILKALGCEVVEIETFQPTVAMLDELGPVKGVVIASPANPTGTVVAGPELAAIAGWCAEHGVQLISDEIYHGIDYGLKPASAWQFSREPVVVNSFSKYFAMTGWRLGWLLVPQRLHRAVECLIGNFNICAPAIAQHAAVAAFTEDSYAELDGHVEKYRTNRDILLKGLKDLKIDRLAPADGAFYVYADIGHLTHDAMSWCQRLLADTGLAIVPGIDFDPEHGSRFIRMSFAGSHAEIEQAVARLGGWLGKP